MGTNLRVRLERDNSQCADFSGSLEPNSESLYNRMEPARNPVGTMARLYATDDTLDFDGQPTRKLRPPSRLAPRAKAIFVRVVSNVAAGHFRPADQELLERYCEAQAVAEMAAGKLFGDGDDASPVDATGKLSAWFQVHTVSSRTANSLASRLRLTVSARTSKAVKTQPAQQSYYDIMELTEGDDADDGVDGDRH